MAKRLQVDFRKPGPTMVEEDGQPRPCASGVGGLNPDTRATIEKLSIEDTDPWGRPLAGTRVTARKP